jgi:heme-degrading monooxygenase HmoA
MFLRINDVTVSPGRIDELGEVLTNKALPVVMAHKGCQGLLCAADRATGTCHIVSLWDTKESLEASERAIASIRSATVDAVEAKVNNIFIAEVLSEVEDLPTRVGSRSRVVRFRAPADSTDNMVDFFETEAVPRLRAQPGFLNAWLTGPVDDERRLAAVSHWRLTAVSHWADTASLESSENSAALREQEAKTNAGYSIERVSTAEIIVIERRG